MPKGHKTGKPAWNRGKPGYWTGKRRPAMSAEGNPAWKGGVDKYCKRQTLQRDDHTCQVCGLREPEIMEVDHIKTKSEFPDLRYELDNLVTLCPNCHKRKTIREHKARIPWNKKK